MYLRHGLNQQIQPLFRIQAPKIQEQRPVKTVQHRLPERSARRQLLERFQINPVWNNDRWGFQSERRGFRAFAFGIIKND